VLQSGKVVKIVQEVTWPETKFRQIGREARDKAEEVQVGPLKIWESAI